MAEPVAEGFYNDCVTLENPITVAQLLIEVTIKFLGELFIMKDCHVTIRKANREDDNAIWAILQPIIHAGETYALPIDMTRKDALAYWFEVTHEVFVAEIEANIVGTYFLCPNQKGGGSHVANCGYMTAPQAQGKGIARMMCAHSLQQAAHYGFKAMQFNFVISSNSRAVKLWESFDFKIVGRLPMAFSHPTLGYIDAFVMFHLFDKK